eukprot:COSAG03_NODE_2535_length_2664_cov_7.655750_1_plen_222_part_00
MWQGLGGKDRVGFDVARAHLDGARADVVQEVDHLSKLKKFQLLDIDVFASSEQADKLEAETEQRNREKWGGILHPETTMTVLYNQMHVGFLLYMLAMLPVRTAFNMVPKPGETVFFVDIAIDALIAFDILLNFNKFTKEGALLETNSKVLATNYLKGTSPSLRPSLPPSRPPSPSPPSLTSCFVCACARASASVPVCMCACVSKAGLPSICWQSCHLITSS